MAKRKRGIAAVNLEELFKANQVKAADRKPTLQEQAMGVQAAQSAQAYDMFANVLARTGYGTPNLGEGAAYPLVRFTFNYWDLISMFEGSWLTRRIVELPCKSMVKAWPRLTSDIEPADITRIDRALRKTNSKGQILTALTWAKLFGGAGCLICLKGQEKELDQPLDLDDVGVGDYKGLIPFDRWSGIYPSTDLCEDINRPLDFGLPEHYDVKPANGSQFKVHSSRILRFMGPPVPTPEKEAYSGWGISVIEPVLQDIQKYDNISFNILALSFRANILGMKFPDLADLLSGLGMPGRAGQKFEERMSALNHLISNQSLIPLPKDGSIESTQYSFSGLSEVFQQFQLAVSGAAQIPVSRLWGKMISGLGNGTNEGDEKVYEERIADDQDTDLRPQLEKLYPVICASELGEVPDDLDLSFPSIRVLDEKEKSEQAKTVVDTVMVAMNGAIISPRTAGKELKQSSDLTGIFTNITDEDIEKLSDEVQPEGEVGGDLFGEEGGGLNPSSSPAKAIKEEDKTAKAKSSGSATESEDPADEGVEGLKQLAKATDVLPSGLMPGDQLRIHGKLLTVKQVIHATKDLFDHPTVQVLFETGEIVPYRTDGDVVVNGSKYDPAKVRAQDEDGPRKDTAIKRAYRDAVAAYRKSGMKMSFADFVRDVEPTIARELIEFSKTQEAAAAQDADGPQVGPRRKVHGLDVVVETPKGGVRSGKGWEVTLPYDYGYIVGIKGADDDSMDVSIGTGPDNGWAYLIDQRHLDGGGYDETKCFLQWPSATAALNAFKAGHHKWQTVMMDWTPMPIGEFKQWLKTGDHTRPVGGVSK